VYSFRYGDKAAHFLLLAALTLLVDLALLQAFPRARGTTAVLAGSLGLTMLMSLEELSQVWMPARNPDVYDVLASWAGIATATLTALALKDFVRVPKAGEGDTA
jgi:VanZ family protein